MADARGRLEWAQTSMLLALIANVNRDPKSPAFQPSEFNPYERRQKAGTVGIDALKVFLQK